MSKGYFPGVGSIDGHPVYIENRNGNSNVKYKQEETLQRAFGVLSSAGIKVAHSRMDCGSFTKEVVKVVEANSNYFYIRAQRCSSLYEKIKAVDNWQTVEIGFKQYQVASIEYAPFGEEKTYRYVISREKNIDGQGDLFTGDDFIYRAIMTNNYEMTGLEVIEFYNFSSMLFFDQKYSNMGSYEIRARPYAYAAGSLAIPEFTKYCNS
jgi:hypothetical protein